MNYLHARAQKRKRVFTIIAVACIIALILAVRLGFFRSLSSFFHAIARPLWKAETIALSNAGSNLSELRTKSDILNENKALKEENNTLLLKMTNYQTLIDENNSLKVLFGRADKPEFILGAIIAKPPRSLYDTLVIDIGSNMGIEVGKRIYADGVILIGTVTEVYAKTALVKLYSTAGEKLEVTVSGINITAEATGRGGGNFEMTFPHDVEIPKGTEVTATGIVPYAVGIVDEVISDPRDPLQKVLMRSPVNIQELKFVQVEK